jgi:Ni/Fe-hydrogenase 1 B-type cytochrome subunit
MRQAILRRHKVYDPVLRIIHGWNALAIFALLATAEAARWTAYSPDSESLWRVHVWLGYGLMLGLAARLIWGISGPAHARWREMWQPGEWLAALRGRQWFAAPAQPGHHPLASAAYVGLYAVLAIMAATGLALAALEQNTGPLAQWMDYRLQYRTLIKEPHEILEYAVLIFVLLHLAMLIVHEKMHGLPMAQAMISGYQYERKDS